MQTVVEEERVELLSPESKKECAVADAMEAFSHFVLHEQREACLAILREECHSDEVGELQGGNADYSIYRVSLTDHPKDAISELLHFFYNNNNNNCKLLTKDSLQRYMLGMLSKFSSGEFEDTKLANVMLVFSFGATTGQVRHIDHTDPNVMICMYMSQNCPSTIVYTSSSSNNSDCSSITNCEELIEYWQQKIQEDEKDNDTRLRRRRLVVPDWLQTILLEHEHADLSSTYFASWKTLQHTLQNFGKLYFHFHQHDHTTIARFEPATPPGTTLIATGNAVHAGPPTKGPRMFAYAIGLYNNKEDDKNNETDATTVNDGELQYSPALFHLDLCCLVFYWMKQQQQEDNNNNTKEQLREVKQFLVSMLVDLIVDMQQKHGNETYARLLTPDRSDAIEWIGKIVQACSTTTTTTRSGRGGACDEKKVDGGCCSSYYYDDSLLNELFQEGITESDRIFAIPNVVVGGETKTSKKQRGRKKRMSKK